MGNENERQDLTPDTKTCRYCSSCIPLAASVCPTCRRDQRWYLNYFRLDHVGLLIALAMMLIAFQQLQEARKERVAASKALQTSQKAETMAVSTTEHLREVLTRVEVQQGAIDNIAAQARQAYPKIKNVQNLLLQAKSDSDNTRQLLKEAEKHAELLKQTVVFNLLLAKAKNDDRKAFDKLRRIAVFTGPFHQLAVDATAQIAFDVNNVLRTEPAVQWHTYSLDPSKDTMDDLLKIYPSLHNVFRANFVSTIWSQKRFSKYSRMEFLYNVIKSDKSLYALNRACMIMNNEAKIGKNILASEEYLKWWESNKERYRKTQ